MSVYSENNSTGITIPILLEETVNAKMFLIILAMVKCKMKKKKTNPKKTTHGPPSGFLDPTLRTTDVDGK